jgi:hypothetical protein
MNDAEKPIRCSCCHRQIAPDDSRCRSCGTDLNEPEVEDCEWDEAFDADDDEEWEDESTPDRGFLIFARIVSGIGALGLVWAFCAALSGTERWSDRIGLSVLGLLAAALIVRVAQNLQLWE